jgi:hypothetical protein
VSTIARAARGGGQAVQVAEAPLSLLDPRVGCVLDGTGDQAAKVATAISLLPATGGHIYQPPGTLRTSAITFTRPVRWEGAGDQAAVIKAASGFTGDLLTVSSSAPFSRVHDVGFDGAGSALRLIKVASARTLLGSCNVGIRVENTNCFFTNTHIWGCTGNGVELRDGNHLFSNCYVETNGGSGFNLFNAPRVRLSNCNIWKNQGQGVSLSGTSDRFSAVGCLIYDQGGNGIQAADCQFGQIVGCTFYDDTTSTQSQDRPVVTTGTADNWIVTSNVLRAADHAVGGNSLVGAGNVVANNIA